MTIRLIKIIAKLPFGVLYLLSDIIYLMVYRVFGYRKNIVRKNLSSSFPEKSKEELRDIEKAFYHWFCDYFVETLKLLSITPEEMRTHLEFRNQDKVVELSEQSGREVAFYLGHYCNWEWMSGTGVLWPEREKDTVFGLIYHPLSNKTMDEMMKQARSTLGGKCIPKNMILRELVNCAQQDQHYVFGYIFDQSPKWENIHLWLDFMNQDTPVFTGAERIVRKKNDIVVFVHMERPERGKYIVTFEIVSENAKEEEEYDITRKCFHLLEEDIKKAPHLYLWTHNRWKRTREGLEEWKERRNK